MNVLKNNKAITLIALVITIIVLLILAGITVAQLSGNNLFENAKLAKEKYQQARDQEDEIIGDYEDAITGDRGNKLNYSTEEQVIGTWINGKPLYRKVETVKSPSTNTTWSTIHTVPNADYLRIEYAELYCNDATNDKVVLNYYTLALLAIKNNKINMYLDTTAFLNKDVLLIFQYTKTTDTASN